MANQSELTSNLEQLLESLIRMVGSSNQKVDSLQRRVTQLELIMKEQQLRNRTQFILQKPAESKEYSPSK